MFLKKIIYAFRVYFSMAMYAFRVYFYMLMYAFRGVFQNPCSRMGTKLQPELPPPGAMCFNITSKICYFTSLTKLS